MKEREQDRHRDEAVATPQDAITNASAVLHFLSATTTALNQWFEGEAVKALERKVSSELETTHPPHE